MSVNMSGPIPNDWLNFYQQTLTGDQVHPITLSSEATTITTTVAPAQLSPEGRVSKPIKRRSRASRRTPTTLLNTDTTNFRAMVQQFTGAPSAPDHMFVPRPLPINPNGLMLGPSHSQSLQHHHYAYTQDADNAFFQRLNNPTGASNVNDDGGGFFPATSS